MSGKSKSRKSVLAAIESFQKQIKKHEEKIKNAHEVQDRYNISHWKKEIQEFEKQLEDLKSELGNATDQ